MDIVLGVPQQHQCHQSRSTILLSYFPIKEWAYQVSTSKWKPSAGHGKLKLKLFLTSYQCEHLSMRWLLIVRWIVYHKHKPITTSFDIMIEWMRLQTHMEWFSHPWDTYTRCLASYYGLTDVSTNMPLSPLTDALDGPDLGSQTESSDTAGVQMISWWSG
jgi:hypothetical protein